MEKTTLLDNIDPEILDTLATRRQAIAKGASVSSVVAAGLAFGSVPLALAALTRDVYGQTAGRTVLDVLKFAYLLENLEAEFYKTVLGRGVNFSSTNNPQSAAFAPVRTQIAALSNATAVTATLDTIRVHEEEHVAFLKAQITALAGASNAPTLTGANFDFTGGNGSGTGPFARATSELQFLLVATQAFEDTGVRAYKGQAQYLMSSPTTLEAALRIHSVEARHAAKIRKLRRETNTGVTDIRYSGTIRGGGAAAAGASNISNPPAAVLTALGLIYGGAVPESNTTHTVNNGSADVAIDASTQLGTIPGGTNAVTEAFDEPLTEAEVTAIVKDFIIDNSALGLP